MKRLLLPLLAALSLPTAVSANVDPEVRKACLPAADFEGCVRAFTKPKEKVKVQEFDFLGQPVIPNWDKFEYIEDNTVIYNSKEINKVKVRGLFGRYIGYDKVVRWYQEPRAGTTGYSTTIGPSYTNCSGVNTTYGSSIGCTTTPGRTINIPGRSAIPGGVKQEKFIILIDCLEKTHKAFPWGTKKKWLPLKNNIEALEAAQDNCHIINSLSDSNFQKYAKGKPNRKDIEAKEILKGTSRFLFN